MKILGMGVPELLIILAVILLIFGPKNLPKLGASVGKTVKSLREGLGGGEKLVEAANPPSLAPSNRPRHPCRGRLRILRRAGGRREATRHLRYDGAVRPDGERGTRASRLARR